MVGRTPETRPVLDWEEEVEKVVTPTPSEPEPVWTEVSAPHRELPPLSRPTSSLCLTLFRHGTGVITPV